MEEPPVRMGEVNEEDSTNPSKGGFDRSAPPGRADFRLNSQELPVSWRSRNEGEASAALVSPHLLSKPLSPFPERVSGLRRSNFVKTTSVVSVSKGTKTRLAVSAALVSPDPFSKPQALFPRSAALSKPLEPFRATARIGASRPASAPIRQFRPASSFALEQVSRASACRSSASGTRRFAPLYRAGP
jgi:hypothetical protein